MQKPLTVDEIKKLKPGSWAIIEQAWDSSPFDVKITEITDYVITIGRVVRAFSSYNQRDTGWRLWMSMPTPQERRAAKWKSAK